MTNLHRLINLSFLVYLSFFQNGSGTTPYNTRSFSSPAQAKSAAVSFMEMSEQSGIRYSWRIDGKRPCTILQTIGNGCAFLDYNRDGNLDILLVGTHPALYRGDGKGHFIDVTHESGLDRLHGHFLGCCVGDYDNDGFPDIYLSAHRGGVLLHNEAGRSAEGKETPPASPAHTKRVLSTSQLRHYKDVTHEAGLKPQPWGTSCTFADMDGDGKLDLYICNYVHFGPEVEPQLCNSHGVMTSCGPNSYKAERGRLYRNLGSGKFQDVTHAWGLETVHGKALGVVAAPNALVGAASGMTLAIANDQIPGDLMIINNRHARNDGIPSGMAFLGSSPYAGMGIDFGDYDNDGRLDIAVATYQNQAKCIFHNEGGAFVLRQPTELGMSASIPRLAFGIKWLDIDNDGRLDLMYANGHVQDNIAAVDLFNDVSRGAVYRQPVTLFRNIDGKRFEDASSRLSKEAQKPIVGRGLAIGDYDNDGRIDALVTDSEGKPLLLHNVTPSVGHWLSVDLVGQKSNRDGYGAILSADAGGHRWTRFCHADGSYLSSSDKRVHFGLGAMTRVDRLKVQWPSGQTDIYRNVPVDRFIVLLEGKNQNKTSGNFSR